MFLLCIKFYIAPLFSQSFLYSQGGNLRTASSKQNDEKKRNSDWQGFLVTCLETSGNACFSCFYWHLFLEYLYLRCCPVCLCCWIKWILTLMFSLMTFSELLQLFWALLNIVSKRLKEHSSRVRQRYFN